jgi:DNA adenine methylase
MTDIQRAVRFYYLLKTGYASKLVDPCLVISNFRKPAFNLLRIIVCFTHI